MICNIKNCLKWSLQVRRSLIEPAHHLAMKWRTWRKYPWLHSKVDLKPIQQRFPQIISPSKPKKIRQTRFNFGIFRRLPIRRKTDAETISNLLKNEEIKIFGSTKKFRLEGLGDEPETLSRCSNAFDEIAFSFSKSSLFCWSKERKENGSQIKIKLFFHQIWCWLKRNKKLALRRR